MIYETRNTRLVMNRMIFIVLVLISAMCVHAADAIKCRKATHAYTAPCVMSLNIKEVKADHARWFNLPSEDKVKIIYNEKDVSQEESLSLQQGEHFVVVMESPIVPESVR